MELPKCEQKSERRLNSLEKWMWFFNYGSTSNARERDRVIGRDLIFEEALEELNRFNWSIKDFKLYEEELKARRDKKAITDFSKDVVYTEGKEDGKAEGKADVIRQIVKHMRTRGWDVHKISQETGFSVKEIEDVEARKGS